MGKIKNGLLYMLNQIFGRQINCHHYPIKVLIVKFRKIDFETLHFLSHFLNVVVAQFALYFYHQGTVYTVKNRIRTVCRKPIAVFTWFKKSEKKVFCKKNYFFNKTNSFLRGHFTKSFLFF